MSSSLHIYFKTRENLTFDKGLELLQYLVKNGCEIHEKYGYWDDEKDDIVPSDTKTAIDKYKQKRTTGFSFKYKEIEFNLWINYFKLNKREKTDSTIYLGVDMFFIRQDEKTTLKNIESLKKLVEEVVQIESIREEIG